MELKELFKYFSGSWTRCNLPFPNLICQAKINTLYAKKKYIHLE